MRIEHLEYFTKVVECGSITTAASQLFISPQGLSQAIKQLEKELDNEFFIRDSNNFTLSAAGQILYDNALRILSVNDDMRVELNQLKAAGKSTAERLRIYVSHSIANTFLPSALIGFHKKYPYIGTRIKELNSMEVFCTSDERKPSVTLFSLPEYLFETIRQKYPGRDYHITHTVPLLALFNRRSPLIRKKAVSSDEILRHPLVLYTTDHLIIKDLFRSDPDQANVILTSPNIETCRTLLANDENAVGFTNSMVEPFFDQSNALITRPVTPGFNFVFGYFSEKPEELPQIADDFIQIILKIMNH